ncbi:MAG: hypothetical protein M3440_04660 [Chloroflexota bacterium]|nr:hypothetical protein [Chloroflexota bacterium]
MREIVERRSRNAKHFDLGDGQVQAVISSGPMHYEHVPGDWRDIVLEFDGDVLDRNPVAIQAMANGLEMRDRASGRGLRWRMPGKPTAAGRAVRGGLGGFAWTFTVTRSGVKAETTIEQSLGRRVLTLPYDLLGDAAPLVVQNDGSLTSGDDFRLPAPVAIGVDGETYPAGRYTTTAQGQQQVVRLHIDDAGIPTPYVLDPTTTFAVSLSGNDGDVQGSTFSSTATFIQPGNKLGVVHHAFARFISISIPKTAIISDATLTFEGAGTGSGAGCNLRIYAHAADNATAPTTATAVTGATLTTAFTDWNDVVTSTGGTIVTSPNFSNVVQEIVNRTGWASGNAIVLQVRDNGSSSDTFRTYASFDHTGRAEPKLTVTYTESTTVSKTGTDSQTLGSTQSVTTLSATAARTDVGTITTTETLTLLVETQDVDNQGAVLSDEIADRQNIGGFDAIDDGVLTADEYAEVTEVRLGTDARTLVATEQVSGRSVVITGRSDAGLIITTESSGITVSTTAALPQNDANTIFATETWTVNILLEGFDESGLGFIDITETARITRTGAARVDSGTITPDEEALRQIIPIIQEPRLAVDIYTLAGARLGSGPVVEVIDCQYGARLDEIGSWSLTVPAIAENSELLTTGREVRIRREGEGLLYRGIIDTANVTVGDRGERMLQVSGQSTAARLLWANTLLAREFRGTTVTSTVGTLLSGTGWAAGTIGTGTTVSARFDGVSVWAALREVAQIADWHVNEEPLTQRVDLIEVGASSGLVLRAVEQPNTNLAVIPLVGLGLRNEHTDLWNRIVPVGGGEGVNALTLQYSNRTTPYTKRSAVGPDGQTYWYLEDSASVTANGARTKVVKFDEVIPLSNSTAEIVSAANTLYGVASAWLRQYANPAEFYDATIASLRHIDPDTGQKRIRPGQTVRLQWTGVVSDESGTRLWRSVDATVYVMGFTRSFDDTGADAWSLELSTTDRHLAGAGDAIAGAIEDIWAIKTAMKPYTYREIHGPYVESIAAGSNARFLVDFDDSVTYLHQAKLRVRKRRVKSNVSGASDGGGQTSSAGGGQTTTSGGGQTTTAGGGQTTTAGGGQTTTAGGGQTSSDDGNHSHSISSSTSSSGGGQTTTSGGGQTSSSGGSHSHSISSTTSSSGGGQTSSSGSSHSHSIASNNTLSQGAHRHSFGYTGPTTNWQQQPYQQQFIVSRADGTTYGMFVARGGSDALNTNVYGTTDGSHTHPTPSVTSSSESGHTHSVSSHSHSVSGQTASSGGAHTHTVDSHTHSVSSHTHSISAQTSSAGGSHTHTISSHTHSVSSHSHAVSDHTHSVSSHTHSVSSHTHTVADHTHALIYGVYLGPIVNSPFMRVWINGIDRTVELTGPWNGDFEVDITRYLTDAAGHVLRQANNIEIAASQLLDAEVCVKSLVTAMSLVPV